MKKRAEPNNVNELRAFVFSVIFALLMVFGYFACAKYIIPDVPPPEPITESPEVPSPEAPPVVLTELPPISELDAMSCFGNADIDGRNGVELDDILLVLQAFSSDPCPWSTDCMVDPDCPQDVCFCRRDGTHVVDLDDILAVLTAFSTNNEGGRQDGICPPKDWQAIMVEKEVAEDEWVLAEKNEEGQWMLDVGQQTRWSVVELP